jgi:hypothetical protein
LGGRRREWSALVCWGIAGITVLAFVERTHTSLFAEGSQCHRREKIPGLR